MALIVETGAGLSNAESYISVAAADTYLASVGETLWAGYDPTLVKEPSLRKATEYMGQVYRARWQGYRTKYDTQALDWPRYGVTRPDGIGGQYASDSIPVEIQRACAKLALRAALQTLAPDIARVTVKEKVGPLEVEYEPGAAPYVRFREIDLLLGPFLKGGSGGLATTVVRQ